MKDKYVESNPEVLGGITVIKGTRIPVDTILERFIHGWTWQEVLEQFPDINP